MKKYYADIDFIPTIPEELIDDLSVIETYENAFVSKDFSHTYAAYKVPEKLYFWLDRYFNYPIVVRYQVIKQKLIVHVDRDVTGPMKFNYIISTGGDNVKTRWWNSVKNPTKILHEETIKPFQWHALKVSVPHDISEVSSPRVSIVVRPAIPK